MMKLRGWGRSVSLLALVGGVIGLGNGAQAQVVTAITPDTLGDRTTGTTANVAGGVTTIDGGALMGANLFHSFARFDLAAGETARWERGAGGAAAVSRLINRVTGGDVSDISGTLDTGAFANADFYFINPAGVVFGPGFGLNVSGAFFVSTANQLNFTDGAAYSATTPGGSVLTMAAASSFGFLGDVSGDVVFARASPTNFSVGLGSGQAPVFVSGRNIEVTNVTLNHTGAGIRIAAVGNLAAALPLTGALPTGLGGAVALTDGGVTVRGGVTGGRVGGIEIAADSIAMTGHAGLGAVVRSDLNILDSGADPIVLRAGVIDMRGFSRIQSNLKGGGQSAEIVLSAVRGAAFQGETGMTSVEVSSDGADGAPGTRGAVSVLAPNATVSIRDAVLYNQGGGLAAPGDLTVVAGTLTMSERAALSAVSDQLGANSDIVISVGQLQMLGGVGIGPRILARTQNTEAGGDVRITANDILMTAAPSYSNQDLRRNTIVVGVGTAGSGVGGRLDIDVANAITLVHSTIANQNDGAINTAAAGALTIAARTLSIQGDGGLSSTTNGAGAGGAMTLRIGTLTMDSAGSLGVNPALGLAGLTCGACIRSASDGILFSDGTQSATGNAGSISITADSITMTSTGPDVAHIATSSSGQAGAAGAITLNVTGALVVGPRSEITADARVRNPAATGGPAGPININAGSVSVGANARISTTSTGSQAAGSIRISAPMVSLSNGSIRSDTNGTLVGGASGNSGGVSIVAPVAIQLLDSSIVAGSTFSSGRGGPISLVSPTITLTNSAVTSLCDYCTGAGGDVAVMANVLRLESTSFIATSARSATGPVGEQNVLISGFPASGDAGNISLNIGSSLSLSGSGIESQVFPLATGNSGAIAIAAPNAAIALSGQLNRPGGGGSYIVSANYGPGSSGAIGVTAKTLTIDAGRFESSCYGCDGGAGDITIAADSVDLTSRAVIASIVSQKVDTNGVAVGIAGVGTGGDITLTARDRLRVDRSIIASASRVGTTAAAGNVLIKSPNGVVEVVGNGSDADTRREPLYAANTGQDVVGSGAIITSTAGAGAGGDLVINARSVTVSNGGFASAGTQGAGRAGAVTIAAVDLSLTDGGKIRANSSGAGAGGGIAITAPRVTLQSGAGKVSGISASGGAQSSAAGALDIQAGTGEVLVLGGSFIETSSESSAMAGPIHIKARDLRVDGAGSEILSENTSLGGGAAGSILIDIDPITIANGGRISTNSLFGAAGNITLNLPSNGLLLLKGVTSPGIITTSSGPGVGGKITITNPLAIIADGSQILALGQAGGANVNINSGFFIRSADSVNTLSVDGALVLDSQVQDVSRGAETLDVAFLDASKVLSGQCPTVRAQGETSQLGTPAIGPYAVALDEASAHAAGASMAACR